MRADFDLRARYRAILSYTGVILLMSAALFPTPLIALLFWPHEWSQVLDGFLIPAGLLAVTGFGLWKLPRPSGSVILTVQEGGVIVLLSWALVILFSAWPLMAVQKLDFTQAVFESVSGWTTTGLSVVDVTHATHCVLLWRSIMQLAGGAGLAIIMIAAITGPIGHGLTAAEGRTDQLVPQVARSAKLVMAIYTGYAIVGVLAYWLAGMTPFDAVNHAFPAISTGGFSNQPESIGHYNSVAIELVSLPLMIMGNLNFLTAYLLLGGNIKAFSRNGEVRLMAFVIPTAVLLLLLFVCREIFPVLSKSTRVAVFETISALTTTGFSTTAYNNWNGLGVWILTVLMLIGGGTCSTAGGIKQYRIYLLYKAVVWELKRPFLPRTAIVENYVWKGEQKDYIEDGPLRQVGVFVFLYLGVYTIGSGILAAHGYGLRESLFEFASALGTVGLSIGVTSPGAPPMVLWTESVGMFLGRLEFFVIFIALGKIVQDAATMLLRKNKPALH